jgi:hypothetical protein
MTQLFDAPTFKTIGGMTANELINCAKIIKTKSNDYLLRIGDYDLNITDDYDLSVSGFGHALCVMTINNAEYDDLKVKIDTIDANYQKDQINANR